MFTGSFQQIFLSIHRHLRFVGHCLKIRAFLKHQEIAIKVKEEGLVLLEESEKQ